MQLLLYQSCYFNQRLSNYNQKLASDTDYLFLQDMFMKNAFYITARKIANDNTFSFMSQVNETPGY